MRHFAAALVFACLAASAGASCIAQPEEGTWINTDAATRSLTRIQLRFVCQDTVINGKLHPPGPPWYTHVFGKCSPSDCDWGEVGAQRIASGHVYAFYDQGFAKRYVFAKMSVTRPGQLWVWMYTDFTDPSRADGEVQNWFSRE
ncbi:MAG TPA: hypothetical protein VF266_24790 [Thermoanaerobaculia bacterium]